MDYGFTTRIDWLKYFINPETGFEGIRLKMASAKSDIQKEYNKKCNHGLVCANATIKNDTLTS